MWKAWVWPSTHTFHSTNISTTSVAHAISISVVRHVCSAMSTDTPNIVARAIVSPRLDYCNALLAGMSESSLDKLQRVQNTLARVVTGLRRRNHITPVLKELHWLPIRARITFKLVKVVYRLRECDNHRILPISSATTYRRAHCDHRRRLSWLNHLLELTSVVDHSHT